MRTPTPQGLFNHLVSAGKLTTYTEMLTITCQLLERSVEVKAGSVDTEQRSESYHHIQDDSPMMMRWPGNLGFAGVGCGGGNTLERVP